MIPTTLVAQRLCYAQDMRRKVRRLLRFIICVLRRCLALFIALFGVRVFLVRPRKSPSEGSPWWTESDKYMYRQITVTNVQSEISNSVDLDSSLQTVIVASGSWQVIREYWVANVHIEWSSRHDRDWQWDPGCSRSMDHSRKFIQRA